MSDTMPKPPVPVAGLHGGSKSNFGEDLDLDELIERNHCHEDYYKVENCLADFNRDWRKCQEQVKKLKQCNDRLNQLRKAQEATMGKH